MRKALDPFSLLLSLDRPKPNALLNVDCALGVRGVVGGVVRLEEEGDVRAGAAFFVTGVDALGALVGFTEALVVDWFGLGDAILLFFSGLDGVMLICDARFTLTAEALEGRGLIGREDLSSGDRRVPFPSCSSLSSSELSSLLRVPARAGDAGFLESLIIDFGRYLGRAVVCEDLGRNDEERVIRPAFGGVDSGSGMATPISSTTVVEAF